MNRRWIIPTLLFMITAINYIDRTNISVAGTYIAKEFHLNPAQLGILFSVFSYTYILAVVPLGILSDRVGTRMMNGFSLGLWSLAAIMTGTVSSFSMLIVSRLLLGLGESASYPTCNQAIREWMPAREIGIATAINGVGTLVGPALGIILTSTLIKAFDWRTSFYILGSAGLVFMVIWFWIYHTPDKAKWLSNEEREYITNNIGSSPVDQTSKTSPWFLLKQRTVWGLFLNKGCQVYTVYLLLTWLPSYLVSARHLNIMQAGWAGAVPYLIASVFTILLGNLSDRVLKNRDKTTGERKKLMVIYSFISTSILLVPFVQNLWLMEIFLTIAITFTQASASLTFALTNDMIVDKRSSGVTFSIVVLGGNIFGLFAPMVTGFIIKATNSYTPSFLSAGILLILGSLAAWFMVHKPIQSSKVRTSLHQEVNTTSVVKEA